MAFDNEAIARGVFEEVWNKGNLAFVDASYDPGYAGVDPLAGALDPASFKGMVGMYRAAFPDLAFTIDELFGADDRVLIRWSAKGTHRGPLLGVEPTGKAITVTGCGVLRLRDGKVISDFSAWDTLHLFQELGLVQPLEKLQAQRTSPEARH